MNAAYCRGCDYNLTGLPEKHRCPECGREFDLADRKTFRTRPRRGIWRKARWVVYPLVLVVLILGGAVGWTWWEWHREQPVIAWARAHAVRSGGVRTRPIGPAWLQRGAGRWRYLLERATELKASTIDPVTSVDLPLSRLRRLKMVGLAGRGIGDHLMSEIGQLSELKELWLVDTATTDRGLARLSASRHIETLYLEGNPLGDQHLAPLADYPELTHLSLYFMPLDDTVVPVITKLHKLKQLNLTGTKITAAGLAELKAALPENHIDGP